MTDVNTKEDIQEGIQYESFADFLESTPPNRSSNISNLSKYKAHSNQLQTPKIQLHCPSDDCNGAQFFRRTTPTYPVNLGLDYIYLYLTYRCSNCQGHSKTFSLAVKIDIDEKPTGEAYKFGELPIFGPPTPPRLIKLIGPDRDVFLKGRRCENQGLGIGAFIYYRRVVENQKNRILEEIIKVSKKLNAPSEKIEALTKAVSETQFSTALDIAKDAIPESLLINGHSPLKLLHGALSEGVHAKSDEDCLAIAGSVRIVLGELSDRLSQALKDEAELSKALFTLMNQKKNG